MVWSQADQDQLVSMIRELDRTDQWKFPVEVRKGLRDLTKQESQLYISLRTKWNGRKRREQVLLLKQLPQEYQELFEAEVLTGCRKLNYKESRLLKSLIDGGVLDED